MKSRGRRPAEPSFDQTTTQNTESQTPSPSPPGLASVPAPIDLTFGIELEFILATRNALPWQQGWQRTQDGLERAFRILTRHALFPRVVSGREEDPLTRYQEWRLLRDSSLSFGPKQTIPDVVSSIIGATAAERNWWRFDGVELTSRVFAAPSSECNGHHNIASHVSMQEVEQYLTALNEGTRTPNSTSLAYVNDTCGFHVHVGVAESPTALPLSLLKHLAYILIQFESTFSSLHPVSRRSIALAPTSTIPSRTSPLRPPAAAYIESNLMGLRRSRHVCSKASLPELAKIQERIFASTITAHDIVALLGDALTTPTDAHALANAAANGKFKFVNFANTVHSSSNPHTQAARTLEFRQHEGTLDIDAITHWVGFVLKLVRAAHFKTQQTLPDSPNTPASQRSPTRMARELEIHMALSSPRRQGNKYKVKCRSQYLEMERLFDLLELSRREKEYWYGRYAKYNPNEVERSRDELFDVVDEERCLVCLSERVQAERQCGGAAPTEVRHRRPRPVRRGRRGQTVLGAIGKRLATGESVQGSSVKRRRVI